MNMVDQPLRKALLDLVNRIAAILADDTQPQVLPKKPTAFVKTTATDFKYKMDVGATYQLDQTIHERHTYDPWELFNFLKQQVRTLPEFRRVAVAIADLKNSSVESVESLVERFAQLAIGRVNRQGPLQAIEEYVDLFMHDLAVGPSTWDISVFIAGIHMEVQLARLGEQALIRRPNPGDFESDQELTWGGLPSEERLHRAHIHAVLELTFESTDQIGVQNEIEFYLNSLRLFRVGSVVNVQTEIAGRTAVMQGIGSGTRLGSEFWASHSYKLGSSDIDTLNSMIGALRKVQPINPFMSAEPQKPDSAVIAMSRYQRAIQMNTFADEKIALAISSLEALFLRDDEDGELKHRLSQRASAFLAPIGFPAQQVYSDIGRAYVIRSKYVHGASLDPRKLKDPRTLIARILTYSRACILGCLQLRHRAKKVAFLDTIDRALIDPAERPLIAKLVHDLTIPTEIGLDGKATHDRDILELLSNHGTNNPPAK